MNLVYVIDVYGRRYRIDKEKYEAGKVLLRRYNNKGKPVAEHRINVFESVMLHRDNIKEFV